MPGRGIRMYEDENGVVFISTDSGMDVADIVAGDNIRIERRNRKLIISAENSAIAITAGQNISIDIDPETGTAIINAITGGATDEHYKGVFDTPEELIAYDENPEQGDYGLIKNLVFSDGGSTSWNGQYKYCFFISGQWTVVDQMLTFTKDSDLLQNFYSVGGSSPVIYLHEIARTGDFWDLNNIPIVETPVVTVKGTSATVECATPGAEIWYTLDGSMPHVNGRKYSPGDTIIVNQPTMLKVVGIKNGMINSEEALVYMDYGLQAPVISLDYRTGVVSIENPNQSGNLYYTTDGSEPTNESTLYTSGIDVSGQLSAHFKAIVVNGYEESPVSSANYSRVGSGIVAKTTNYAEGRCGIRVRPDTQGAEVHITRDGSIPDWQSENGTDLWIYTPMFERLTLKYMSICEGYIPSSVLTSTIGLTKPDSPSVTFNPNNGLVTMINVGNTANIDLKLTPLNLEYGCGIYYTMDGSTPTEQSAFYAGPFRISGNVTVKAILIAYGQYASNVVELPIVVTSEPSISLDSDTGDISITGPAGASLYYTTNGNTPTTGSTPYTQPFNVENQRSVTVKAIAVINGQASAVAEATFQGLLLQWSGSSSVDINYSTGKISSTPKRAADGATVFYDISASGCPGSWKPYTDTPVSIDLFDSGNPREFLYRQTKPGFIPAWYGGVRYGYTTPDAPVITYDPDNVTATIALAGNTADIPLQTNNNVPSIGARIYYTLDGSTPTDQSSLYTGGDIQLQAGQVLKVKARLYGRFDSGISVQNVFVPESELSDSTVANIIKDIETGKLYYIPQTSYVRSALDTTNYVEKDWMRQERNRDGITVVHYKTVLAPAKYAEDNRYKLYCDTTANGGFTIEIGSWSTVNTQTIAWNAGDTLDDIVALFTNDQYVRFSHVQGEDFIRILASQSSPSYDCTLSNNTGGNVVDLSKQCRIGGIAQAETHRVWQGADLHTMSPDAGIPAANTIQYAKNGLNLSSRCGGNLTSYMNYYEVSGSGHGGVDTYLAEDAISARMSRIGFASCNGSSNPDAQALYDKYEGSWEAYMEASMIDGESTNADGIVDQTYSVADTVSLFMASVETADFTGEWIPAFPIFYNAYQVVDIDFGHGIVGANHDMSVYIDVDTMTLLNSGGCNISRTSSYWSVAQFNASNGWVFYGSRGTVNYSYKSNAYSARVLAYIRPNRSL